MKFALLTGLCLGAILAFLIPGSEGACDECPCPVSNDPGLSRWERNARDQIQVDEGTRRYIYKDTLGILTVGIGHKVLSSDPEFRNKKPYTDKFSCNVIVKYFNRDFNTAVGDAKIIVSQFNSLPNGVKEILVNMAYQLGRSRLKNFRKMLAAISKKDYQTAADEMVDSRWYGQSGNRSRRLVQKMRAIG